MNSITPRGGWNPRSSSDPGIPLNIIHSGQPSFLRDLSQLSGRQAGNVSFGTVFGATSGFLMAKFLVSLLKAALGVGVLLAIVLSIVICASHQDQTKAAHIAQPVDAPVAERTVSAPLAEPIAASPEAESTSPAQTLNTPDQNSRANPLPINSLDTPPVAVSTGSDDVIPAPAAQNAEQPVPNPQNARK